jgi:DNA polymerase III delta subunit
MPKIEPKAIHRELEQGLIWPVYWLYGSEKLKSRELLVRIRQASLGVEGAEKGLRPEDARISLGGLNEEVFDGDQTDCVSIVDSAQSLTLGGGIRFITVRDAHLLKNQEELASLLGGPAKRSELASVCVFLSKDLDGRKKFTKVLLDKAAVVPCEEVPEAQRESWVLYLAKRRGLTLSESIRLTLCSLDPWSLELIEQELEKFAIAQTDEVLLGGGSKNSSADFFIESFFNRDLKAALPCVSYFADEPHMALPLLGLLGWNIRQLASFLLDKENGTRNTKLSPFIAERLRYWSPQWSLQEALQLQEELADLDFNLKQKPLLPLGLWTQLVNRFCNLG